MKEGNWLVLARTRFMLNALEDTLYSKGIYYQNKFKKNYEQDLYDAVVDWENLRKGSLISTDKINRIVSYMSPENYQKEQLKYLNKEAHYGIDELYKNRGLNTKAVWYEAFDNAPEKKVGNSERVYFPERNTMKYELQELLGLEQNNWKKNYLAWKEELYTPEEIEQKKELL